MVNPYVQEIKLSLSQMPEKERNLDGLMRIVGGITMSTVDFLQPNYTNGLEVRKIKEAYEEIAKEMIT